MRNLFLPLALVGVLTCGSAQAADSAKSISSKKAFPPDVVLESRVNPEEIRAHVAFSPATCSKAAVPASVGATSPPNISATKFALYGLKPLGDNGTYMQKVPHGRRHHQA